MYEINKNILEEYGMSREESSALITLLDCSSLPRTRNKSNKTTRNIVTFRSSDIEKLLDEKIQESKSLLNKKRFYNSRVKKKNLFLKTLSKIKKEKGNEGNT